MHNPFSVALEQVYVNGRGEICDNLETTKSKVGAEVRERREADQRRQDFLNKTANWRREIVKARRAVEDLRKEGMRLQGADRTQKFRDALEAEKETRRLQAKINAAAKRYNQ